MFVKIYGAEPISDFPIRMRVERQFQKNDLAPILQETAGSQRDHVEISEERVLRARYAKKCTFGLSALGALRR